MLVKNKNESGSLEEKTQKKHVAWERNKGKPWNMGIESIESSLYLFRPLKTNMDPQDDWLENVFSLKHGHSWYLC